MARATSRLGFSEPYVVYLGAIERTKNVHGVLEAYAKFRERHSEIRCVIGGEWRTETAKGYRSEIQVLIHALGIERHVRFTGYLSTDDYRAVLAGARMLIFPSFGEGFGLPPLEAMASGVPVITSNLPVFQELYGDSALLVDVARAEAIADTMVRVVEEKGLAEVLIANGLRTAELFSWKTTCARLTEVLTATGRQVA
jgi:glycosyltransferase involved in cell wall biosynthesis